MVRLVFRPYTQLRRSICTSESLRTSIRVSPDFILAGHSSPSFGYQRARYRCAPVRRRPTAAPEGTTIRNAAGPLERPGNADDRPRYKSTERDLGNVIFPKIHFHCAFRKTRRVSYCNEQPTTPPKERRQLHDTPRLARTLDSLVRVSRRVGKRPEDSSQTGTNDDARSPRPPLHVPSGESARIRDSTTRA